MRNALTVVVMIALVGIVSLQSAPAGVWPVPGTDLPFFDPGSWVGGRVPGLQALDKVQWGYQLLEHGSMIYDPATTGDPMTHVVGAGNTGDTYCLGASEAGASYTFTQESGDLEWAHGSDGARRPFMIATAAQGTYVLNGGTARFGDSGLRMYSTETHDAFFDHNAGDVVVAGPNPLLRIGYADVGAAVYSLAAGTVQTQMLEINSGGVLNFDPGSTGILYVDTLDKTTPDIVALIADERIVDLGGEMFLVTELVAGKYAGYTEVKLDLPPDGVIPEPAMLAGCGFLLLALRKRRN